MADFFNWLVGGSVSAIIFIAMVSVLGLGVTLIYAISFLQGREVSFWPPKIGEKPEQKKQLTSGKRASKKVPLSIGAVLTTEPMPFEEDMTDFTELYVLAMNLRRTLTNYYSCFEKRLSEGANLRFLLVDPDSDAVPIIAERNYIYRDAEQLRRVIQSTLDNLARLCSDQPVKGTIEVRVLRHVPAYGLTLLNPERSDGRMRVDLYPYRVPPDTYPSFWVTREHDEHWYQFFLNQFYLMWDSGKPFKQDKSG